MNTRRPVVRLAGWMALALLIAACSSTGQIGSPEELGLPEGRVVVDPAPAGDPESDRSGGLVLEATAGPDLTVLLKTQLNSFAAVVPGPLGVADTLLYEPYQTDGSLSDRPYDAVGDPVLEGFFNFYKPANPEEIVSLSRLVVRGEIVGFGRPHFNSTGGEYWSPAYHEEPGVVDVALRVYREVVFRVDEVLGDAAETGLEPGTEVVFTTRGGQVRVTPTAVEEARTEGPQAEHELAPTNPFVISDPSPVDLSVGEEVVLFLNWRSIDGLYNGQYGYKFELFPANEILYKFRIDGVQLINDATGATIPLDQLAKLIQGRLAEWAGQEPEPGVHVAQPHHAVPPEEEGEPYVPPPDEPPHDHGEEQP